MPPPFLLLLLLLLLLLPPPLLLLLLPLSCPLLLLLLLLRVLPRPRWGCALGGAPSRRRRLALLIVIALVLVTVGAGCAKRGLFSPFALAGLGFALGPSGGRGEALQMLGPSGLPARPVEAWVLVAAARARKLFDLCDAAL